MESFPERWIHGSEDCATNTDEAIQKHPYDGDTWIFRQSKCSDPPDSFEGPFLYLLLGDDLALLLDTGASASVARFPIGALVREILEKRVEERGGRPLPLVVCHTHAHGDHRAGDGQVRAATGATVIEPGLTALATAFHGTPGAAGVLRIDLGNRPLDALAIPGHEPNHIALYDRNTRLLFTGDSLYPGVLTVSNWADFRGSARRLAQLVDEEPVDFVLGAHVEMKRQPGEFYEPASPYQPEEHVLQLEPIHAIELHDFVRDLGPDPPRGATLTRSDFAIRRF